MNFEVVFIGEINDGKTTIVSSLIEDENAIISSTPGTTTRAHRHSLTDARGNPILCVWDTPGFEETDDLHAWFMGNAARTDNLAAEFIRTHQTDTRWERDMELLRPIASGALVVFVAASNRKPQSTDQKQLELIRICGANRIALINRKPGKDYTAAWREVLKREIGIVRSYSPLTAGIRQRLELLDKLADCAESHETSIRKARDELERDWQDRLGNLARMMLSTLQETTQASAFSSSSRSDAQAKLSQKLERLETRFRRNARDLFNHRNLAIDADFFRADITVAHTWKAFGIGMAKTKAVFTGAIAGAAAGLALDASIGGLSGGAGAAMGGALGAGSTAFLIYRPFAFIKVGRDGYEARIELRSQLLAALLDRMILYARCILRVSHGDRPTEAIQAETSMDPQARERLSRVDAWDKDTTKAWATVIGKMNKAPTIGALEEKEPQAFTTVIRQIITDTKRSPTHS